MDLNTPTATKLLGPLALLVLIALGWVFVVGPQTSDLSMAREEVVSIRDRNSLLTIKLAELEAQREGLAATRQIARDLAVKVPPTADQPGLFEEVTAAADEAGIGADGLTDLTPTPPILGGLEPGAPTPTETTPGAAPVPGAELARQSVTVAVTGTYDETQRLLENLESMPRAYLITGVALGLDPAEGDYTTTITGEMFVMPPVQDPGKSLSSVRTGKPQGAT